MSYQRGNAGPASVVVIPVVTSPPDDGDERRWWLRGGWPLWVLVSVVVLLTTGGGVALASAHTRSPSASAAATADVQQLAPGVVRIEDTKWTQTSKGGPRGLLVTYRSRRSGSRGAMLLARSAVTKRWTAVYTGKRVTSDVLVPSGSALDGDVALSLIDALNRLSHGAYDIPATPANVALLEVWMDHEGGLWADNPLNTSLDASDYPHQITTSGEDTGIPIYPNLSVGVTDTALTLLGNPAYRTILKVLAGGSGSCTAFGAAVVQSPWASSHYGYDAGSFCPSGQASDVTVSTPLAPHGVKRSDGSSAVDRKPRGHAPKRTGSTRATQSTGAVVSSAPAMRSGG